MVRNFLYRSETLLQPHDLAFRVILEQARSRNSNMAITGYLHWEDGTFHQWVEGPEAELRIVEKCINESRSHYGQTILSRDAATIRQFPGWHMALGLSEKNSLFDFVATQGVRTLDRTEYAAGVLAFMRAKSETTSPF
ncbi:BLUF domain-containing protein [Paracoccus marcusii]|uniref:BLUF domain-containing protein n=1 Tax=Paracoccus marcusii TaxID=59779 RepID=UPI0032660733